MPAYNSEEFISEAIDSILSQTFPNFELIISDDGSRDRTLEIIQSYAARDHRIRVLLGRMSARRRTATGVCVREIPVDRPHGRR